MQRILLTTTSYQDTPGTHHDLLASAGFEVVRERGPLSEARMLELMGDIDGLLCGDDAITAAVIDSALPRLRVIAKYGIGLDKVDVAYATKRGIPVTFTPGVNHTTVAEHTFGLLLALVRQLVTEANYTRAGQWKRLTGHELMGQTLGIVGLGRIGREVAKRAHAFGMPLVGYDVYWPEGFAKTYGITQMATPEDLFRTANVVTLHTNLNEATRHVVNRETLALLPDEAILLNCGRGELVETEALLEALESGKLAGYGADVLDEEPPPPDHPLLTAPNTIITPHIGSRTYESVQRQATMATENLIRVLRGEKPLAQANDAPIPLPPVA